MAVEVGWEAWLGSAFHVALRKRTGKDSRKDRTSLRVVVRIHGSCRGTGRLARRCQSGLRSSRGLRTRPPSLSASGGGTLSLSALLQGGAWGSECDSCPEATPLSVGWGFGCSRRARSSRQLLDPILLRGSHGGRGAYGPGSGEWRVPQAVTASGVGDGVF